jgi:Predicted Fe-S-cluster oxidoreductase
MLRDIDLDKVSDGKLYSSNDMAKTDCNGCKGCSSCCRGMGSSIVLDPLDAYRLCTGLKKSFEELLSTCLELNVVDGIILPNLRMTEKEEACVFLSDGRCSIHSLRPGMCRIFPLGRFYENHSFQYFLQIHECPAPGKSKVKIRKWIDTPDIKRYETFIADWHYYLKPLHEYAMDFEHGENIQKLNMYILKQFYLKPYSKEGDFYQEFYERLLTAKDFLLG